MTTHAPSLPRVYVTYEEAALMLSCSKRSISRKVRAGELQARGSGSGRRVVYASVLAHPDCREARHAA